MPLGTRRQHKRVFCDTANRDTTSEVSTNNDVRSSSSTVQYFKLINNNIVFKLLTEVDSVADPPIHDLDNTHECSADASLSPPLDNEVFKMTLMTGALQNLDIQGEDSTLAAPDQAVFEKLWRIDDAFRLHASLVGVHIAAMDEGVRACDDANICASKVALVADMHSLTAQLEELNVIDTLGDKAHEAWRAALRKSMEQQLDKLGASGYTDLSETCSSMDPETKLVDTSAYNLLSTFSAFNAVDRRIHWNSCAHDEPPDPSSHSAGYLSEPLRPSLQGVV